MYFRSLLKTRLLRPIAFGLSHPYLPISSVCHWIKCTPAKTYFYLFSTQKQQSQKGSVKDSIENTNTKGEGETPAKNPKKLQKEINKNSNTKKEVEIQANDQKEQQTANNPIKNSQTKVEIETQVNDQKEQQTANDPIKNSHTKVEVKIQDQDPKEQKREVKPQNSNSKEFQQKLEALLSMMVQETQKKDQNIKIMIEEIKKKDQIMIEEIKKKDQILIEEIIKKNLKLDWFQGLTIFFMVGGILIGVSQIIQNYLAYDQHLKEKQRLQKLPQENYIKSKEPPTETQYSKFVEEYVETSSRASVKQMLIQSDKSSPKKIQYISGVPGVGKTTTFKEIIKQMKNEHYEICYFSFKNKPVDTTIGQILTSANYLQKSSPKDRAQNEKKYLIIDQLNLITCIKEKSIMTMEQRVAKKDDIVREMITLKDYFGYNIVFISSDLNFFDQHLMGIPGAPISIYKFLNFNQPSKRQLTQYLKGLRSKTEPVLKLDEVIIAQMIQNYSTFRETKFVLGTYLNNSGDRANILQQIKQQMDLSKLMIQKSCRKNEGELTLKDEALYRTCLQKSMPKLIDDQVYNQLNKNNILNQRYFRNLSALRGFELYYNENPSKFEKNLGQQFKDHKIHCKEVFLDRPTN